MNKEILEKLKTEPPIIFSKESDASVEGNVEKYFSYKEAFARINKALEQGFYLEAITIEESILTDRLQSFLLYVIEAKYLSELKNELLKIKNGNNTTIGSVISFYFKQIDKKFLDDESILNFFDKVKTWKDNRNKCLHTLAKSLPTEPTKNYIEFLEIAKTTAIHGFELIREYENKLRKYKI